MFNLFTIAFAQAQTTGSGQAAQSSPWGGLSGMIPIVLMIVIFYFLLIRPQQKKEKDRKLMITDIKKGDKILTVGGIYGIVSNLKDENSIILKIADGTKVELARSAIQNKIS